MTIRVLVSDDQALVRGSFRILVDTASDLTSVGEATRQITAGPRTQAVRVLILTTFDLDEYVFAAIRVVAAGDALLAPTVTRRLIEEFT